MPIYSSEIIPSFDFYKKKKKKKLKTRRKKACGDFIKLVLLIIL